MDETASNWHSEAAAPIAADPAPAPEAPRPEAPEKPEGSAALGILGALLGMKLMRKHFVKAGLAQ